MTRFTLQVVSLPLRNVVLYIRVITVFLYRGADPVSSLTLKSCWSVTAGSRKGEQGNSCVISIILSGAAAMWGVILVLVSCLAQFSSYSSGAGCSSYCSHNNQVFTVTNDIRSFCRIYSPWQKSCRLGNLGLGAYDAPNPRLQPHLWSIIDQSISGCV